MNGERRSVPRELVGPVDDPWNRDSGYSVEPPFCLAPGDFARRYPGLTGSAQRMDVAA